LQLSEEFDRYVGIEVFNSASPAITNRQYVSIGLALIGALDLNPDTAVAFKDRQVTRAMGTDRPEYLKPPL